jgi:RimJ/RimL family protein N-acetyltransferase
MTDARGSADKPASPQVFIRGERIVLRGFRKEDLATFARWLDSEEVTHFLEMGARPTRESDLDRFWQIANDSTNDVVFAIADAEDGSLVGTCGLYNIDWVVRRAQFNILIGEPKVWDNGFGQEAARLVLDYAFGKLNLSVVHLGVNADNERAIQSYKKVGFVLEGRRRRFIYRNGQYYDLLYMGVLREEFEAK